MQFRIYSNNIELLDVVYGLDKCTFLFSLSIFIFIDIMFVVSWSRNAAMVSLIGAAVHIHKKHTNTNHTLIQFVEILCA